MDELFFTMEPKTQYLASSPIVFSFSTVYSRYVDVSVYIEEKLVYTGVVFPKGSTSPFESSISLSDIFSSYMKKGDVSNKEQLLSKVSNSVISVRVVFSQYGSLEYTGKVYKGGISKEMLRYLSGKQMDIFQYKLLQAGLQFFMTTRTAGRHISLKESELYPFYFIASGKTYTAVTEYGHTFTLPTMTTGEVYAFNVNTLRRLSHLTYNALPAFIGILVDGQYVFDITVTKPSRNPHKYVLRFLNAYSAFEKMEITGKAVSEPEVEDEESPFMVYDEIVDDYIEHRVRRKIREVIKAETGWKNCDEFLFLRDLLQSNEVYLESGSNIEYEVTVKSDSFSYDIYPGEPASVSLSILRIENDSNYSPEKDESAPDFRFGEGIWFTGQTNGYGFLYSDSTLNTI